MAPKLALLREFYRGLPKDRAKIETRLHGFRFLDWLLAGGAALEYGQLTLTGLLHKYKLSHLPEASFVRLLEMHLQKECNVCLYFGSETNDLCCINLDNNHTTENTVVIPELALAVRTLHEQLSAAGCAPLVIASGRGFHLWLRLDAPVANQRLHDFMLRAAAKALAALHSAGLEPARVKFNFYPDPRTQDTVSLRLFGSDHAKNRVFSRIWRPDGLLDEPTSWDAFATYLEQGTVTTAAFARGGDILRA